MTLTEKSYTPLSLVGCLEFTNLISSLDLHIVNVLRSHLSRKLILLKYEAVESDVMKYHKFFSIFSPGL